MVSGGKILKSKIVQVAELEIKTSSGKNEVFLIILTDRFAILLDTRFYSRIPAYNQN